MASALFKLSSDGGSTYAAAGTALADAAALAYAGSGSYSIKAALDSTAGVGSVVWTITSADDAHIVSLPTVTTNAGDKTCTFSVPKTGGAWLLQCQINGGVNLATGKADPTLTRSLAIKVLNSAGQQEVAVGESNEAGAYGWTKAVNDVARTGGGGGGGITEAQLRTAAASLAASLDVNGQKVTNLGTPTASTDAATKGYVDSHLPVVIYRQGVASPAPGEYATWAAALAAAQALPGRVVIYVDDQDDPPAIPSGTHALQQRIEVVGLCASTERIVVSVADGAVLQDCPRVAALSLTHTLSTPAFTSTRDGLDLELDNVFLAETEVPGSSGPLNLNYTYSKLRITGGSLIQGGTLGVGTLPSGKTLDADLVDCSLDDNFLQGGAGDLYVTVHAGVAFPPLSLFTGTVAGGSDQLREALANDSGDDYDFGAHKITNLADPTSAQHAATKASSEAAATAAAQSEANLRTAAAALTLDVDFNAVELTNVAAPTSDAGVPYFGVVKEYADGSGTKAIGSTSVSLSASDLVSGQVKFTGTLTGDTTVTMPSGLARSVWLINGTSGTYTLKIAGSSSGSAFLAPGQARRVAHDSSGVLRGEALRVEEFETTVDLSSGYTIGDHDVTLFKVPAAFDVDRVEIRCTTSVATGSAAVSAGVSGSYNQLVLSTAIATAGDVVGLDTAEAGADFADKIAAHYSTAQTLTLRVTVTTATLTAGALRVMVVGRYVGE